MKKQTSIEWLEQEFLKLEDTVGVYGVIYELIDKAKAMHKEEIKSAYADGAIGMLYKTYKGFHEYYNETYGGGKDE